MLSEKLKENTKINHQLLEKKLVANMRSITDKQGYAKLISLFYGFFGGLELLINKQLDISFLPDYPQRRKTTALADDLTNLDANLPALATGDALPTINNHMQALGALYVIEGSTLGGKIISKMMQQQLSLSDNTGLSFFNSYGEQTLAMWQVFKQAIDRPLNPVDEDMVIKAANDTFIKFGEWFDSNGL
jgi:heme oxygenase